MKAIIFSTHSFDRESFANANQHYGHQLTFVQQRLDPTSAALGRGYPAVIAFFNDRLELGNARDTQNRGYAISGATLRRLQ